MNIMWWDENEKFLINEKQECHLTLGKCENQDNIADNKANTKTKQAIWRKIESIQKGIKQVGFDKGIRYQKKTRGQKDCSRLSCVKDKQKNIHVRDEMIRWKE